MLQSLDAGSWRGDITATAAKDRFVATGMSRDQFLMALDGAHDKFAAHGGESG